MRARLDSLLGREIVRFGLVGAVNTGLDLGVYFLLQLGGTPILLANLASTSAGLTFSFLANRVFTFSARPARTARSQVLLFVVCTGVGLWIVQPLVILGMDGLLAPMSGLGDLRILIAKGVAIGLGMIWNWTLYNRVVFRPGRTGTTAPIDVDLPATARL